MLRLSFVTTLLAAVIAAAPAAAPAASSMPSCAAGDPVVWENTKSHVYHLPGDKYYGTTKHGVYACKSAADAAGYHAPGAAKSTKTKGASPAAPSPEPT